MKTTINWLIQSVSTVVLAITVSFLIAASVQLWLATSARQSPAAAGYSMPTATPDPHPPMPPMAGRP